MTPQRVSNCSLRCLSLQGPLIHVPEGRFIWAQMASELSFHLSLFSPFWGAKGSVGIPVTLLTTLFALGLASIASLTVLGLDIVQTTLWSKVPIYNSISFRGG